MSDQLLLLLGQTPDEPVHWAAFEASRLLEGGRVENAAGLSSLADEADAAGVVVALLPGEQVACRALPSAPRGAAKVRAAAAYLMEDELGEAGEALALAVAAERTPPLILAVRRAILDDWMARFAEAGIECDVLSADYAALAASQDLGTLVVDGERVVASFGASGAAMEQALFVQLAPDMLADGPARVGLLGDERAARLLPESIAVDMIGPPDAARILALYAQSVADRTPPNFVRRPLINRRAIVAAAGPWRRAGLLAAGLVATAFITMIADGMLKDRAATRWDEAARALHAERHPEAAAADPANYARQRLAQGPAAAGFIDLSGHFTQALEENEAIQIDRIRYNQSRGEYVVSLRSESDGAIEKFKAALAAAGVDARDSGGFRNNGGVWTGELVARAL